MSGPTSPDGLSTARALDERANALLARVRETRGGLATRLPQVGVSAEFDAHGIVRSLHIDAAFRASASTAEVLDAVLQTLVAGPPPQIAVESVRRMTFPPPRETFVDREGRVTLTAVVGRPVAIEGDVDRVAAMTETALSVVVVALARRAASAVEVIVP